MQGRTPPARKRLIFLSQLFDPEPAIKGTAFIAALQARGFDVEVVTGFPNYPGGKVYPGFRIRPLQRDMMDGVAVTRLAIVPSHSSSGLMRMVCYVSFFLSSLLYLVFGARRADVVFVSYPSLTAGFSAALAKLIRRTPVVLDIQDMWPDSLPATNMVRNRHVLRVIGMLCKILYRAVDHIVVLSPGFKRLLEARGVAADKISVVYNWADGPKADGSAGLPAGFAEGDGLRVLFAGNMGAAQNLRPVLEGAGLVQASAPDIRFYFMGGGIEADGLKAFAAEHGLANVTFLPRVPMAMVPAYLAAADALLVHLKRDPLFAVTIPSKTQAYLAAGRPILMGVEGDAAALVAAAGAGLAFMPDDAQAFAAAVLKMNAAGAAQRQAMGAQGKRYYDEQLALDKAADALAQLFHRFAARRAGQGAGA